ncbi:MAG: hypothetical protein Q8P39_02735 [Candidatus Yanofskybacteria bacterium]|nr:hypothetical protein [Candidatus Yanofskybacteria bacterium]
MPLDDEVEPVAYLSQPGLLRALQEEEERRRLLEEQKLLNKNNSP